MRGLPARSPAIHTPRSTCPTVPHLLRSPRLSGPGPSHAAFCSSAIFWNSETSRSLDQTQTCRRPDAGTGRVSNKLMKPIETGVLDDAAARNRPRLTAHMRDVILVSQPKDIRHVHVARGAACLLHSCRVDSREPGGNRRKSLEIAGIFTVQPKRRTVSLSSH
jgi:hypothetical protein